MTYVEPLYKLGDIVVYKGSTYTQFKITVATIDTETGKWLYTLGDHNMKAFEEDIYCKLEDHNKLPPTFYDMREM